jgi:SAM-dependent methyltransferase
MLLEAPKGAARLQDVHDFWNTTPLFTGEGTNPPGSRQWFEEHESVYIKDCFAGHAPDPIFTRGFARNSALLDVGCGPGFWVRYFLRNGYANLQACDLTPRSVELARRSLDIFGLQAEIKVGNAESLPYADQSFDHVNCQGVIHHTPDPAACIAEFHRVLRPGGSVCLSVYHRNFLLRNTWLLKPLTWAASPFVGLKGRGREKMLASGDPDEIVRLYDGQKNPLGKAFTRSELGAMVGKHFRIEEFGFFFFPARALPIRIPRALHGMLHRRFGFMIIVRGTKA